MSDAPILFADRGCPFAHRVLALVDHLGLSLERRESSVGQKPEGLDRYSEAGRIPLLVHGELVINESRVMLEHLAELHAFADAYPADLTTRTRHRHAMAIADDFLAPLLMSNTVAGAARLADVSQALERAVRGTPATPCLLAFQLAPIWLRFRWWKPGCAAIRAVEARPLLADWLDAVSSFDSITRTTPPRAEQVAAFAEAQAAGLIS